MAIIKNGFSIICIFDSRVGKAPLCRLHSLQPDIIEVKQFYSIFTTYIRAGGKAIRENPYFAKNRKKFFQNYWP